MAEKTLFNKIWDLHKVAVLTTGQHQLLVGRHYLHEVTSPQAFAMLRENNLKVAFPKKTFATVDHIIPTDDISRPYKDHKAELMAKTIEENAKEFDITYLGPESGKQGVMHIIAPELGLTLPGMTIVCGDSHTATHGAFGSLAFGIGTTEVKLVLETQTLALSPLKVRRINVNGTLKRGVTAKDVILKIITILGVKGGLGFAYEYGGDVIDNMDMEERMTVCNMSIEGGARIGYINPDNTTFEYIRGKEYAPNGKDFDKAVNYWESICSDKDAKYDDVININALDIDPMVTWGITPAQAININEAIPLISVISESERKIAQTALDYMSFKQGQKILGLDIDVVFIGSCTNGRISDFREAAAVLKGRKVKPGLRVLIVPGSQKVKGQVEKEGLHKIFIESGAEWRLAGCSMCLAMNPDKLEGKQICASTSNRNFMGRQGSSSGRTILMSAGMAAAAAIEGKVTDVRKYL